MRGGCFALSVSRSGMGQDLANASVTDAVCSMLLDQAQHQSRPALVESEKSYRLAYELSHDAKVIVQQHCTSAGDKRGQAGGMPRLIIASSWNPRFKTRRKRRRRGNCWRSLTVKQVPSGSSQIAPTHLHHIHHIHHIHHLHHLQPRLSVGLALKAGDSLSRFAMGLSFVVMPWRLFQESLPCCDARNETFLRIEWAEMNTEVASKIEVLRSRRAWPTVSGSAW